MNATITVPARLLQDAAEKEGRPEILSETVHNLAKSRRTGAIWLIDNESGMIDAYDLLYPDPKVCVCVMRMRSAFKWGATEGDFFENLAVFSDDFLGLK